MAGMLKDIFFTVTFTEYDNFEFGAVICKAKTNYYSTGNFYLWNLWNINKTLIFTKLRIYEYLMFLN